VSKKKSAARSGYHRRHINIAAPLPVAANKPKKYFLDSPYLFPDLRNFYNIYAGRTIALRRLAPCAAHSPAVMLRGMIKR